MNIRKTLKRLSAAALCGAVAVSGAASVIPATAAGGDAEINFAKALQYSMYMYDANMCGTDVSENCEYTWRGDCHTYDSQVAMNSTATNLSESFISQNKAALDPDGDGFINVSGGFHDAGDHVKFGMPENYAAATVGWGYYEFRDSYVSLGLDSHVETILRYFNDYLMRCTFLDSSGNVVAHCYQVGDGDVDHAFWNAPEIDDMERRAFFLTADKPQTDYVVSAVGSLAINYMNFKDTDPEYAKKSLDYAKALWKFANDNELQLSDNADGPKMYYNSSKWEDDYCWAAAWMYMATGDVSSLKSAAPYYDYYAPSGYCYNWNDMWGGTACLWGVINQEHPEINLVQMVRDAQGKNEYVFKDFWDEVYKCYPTWKGLESPGGYAFLSQWGSARYNTAMQLIGLVYDKYTNDGKPGEFSNWAKSQMEYIMGNNPLGRAYIVGYSDSAARFPHHRAASGLTKCEDTNEHRYVLYGALVGGPDGSDKHIDVTSDYIYNEVTIDYNAAFVGASAGLYSFFGTPDMKITPDFPPAVSSGGGESGGNDFWVDAYAVDDPQTTGAGVTKLAVLMRTDSVQPKTDLSMRYFFSIEEMNDKSNISNVKSDELYDQAMVEAGYDGVISAPKQYDPSFDPNIYYVEVKWDGYKVANSNKKYQFAVGLYYGDNWDPTNDWSYQDITKCVDTYQDGSETRTDHICVYSDGVLVGGVEPNGKTPEKQPEQTTTTPAATTTTKTTTTTTTTTASAETTTTTSATTVTTASSSSEVSTTTSGQKVTTTAAPSSSDDNTNPSREINYGDVNLDNSLTMLDIIYLNKYFANIVKLNDNAQANADCCKDGVLNSADSTALIKYLAKKIDSLPFVND